MKGFYILWKILNITFENPDVSFSYFQPPLLYSSFTVFISLQLEACADQWKIVGSDSLELLFYTDNSDSLNSKHSKNVVILDVYFLFLVKNVNPRSFLTFPVDFVLYSYLGMVNSVSVLGRQTLESDWSFRPSLSLGCYARF